ncbi:MAG: MBL fold metallo-hydrolase [Minisyncoccia bacterium]
MKIKKLGHCCLIIEENGLRVLTDPGSFTVEAIKAAAGIDAILITDEHGDHLHIDSVKVLLQNNPDIKILTQRSVQKILADNGISSELLLDGQKTEIKGVALEGCGEKHAVMHSSIPQSENTGFIIAGKFFYPGDALTDPKRPIDILALPVAGPWVKISEAVDYALQLKPKSCFPVHDGTMTGSAHRIPAHVLPANGIEFVAMKGGDEHLF